MQKYLPMQEKLLHYIWRFQLFQSSHLQSVCGQSLNIYYPGFWNNDQGPDFLNADLVTGNIRWAGHVELHVHSSDWRKHQHDTDARYQNVILHVVWEHDIDLNLPFPTLELRNRVPKILLEKYDRIMNAEHSIPCKALLAKVNSVIIEKWKENMFIDRLNTQAKLYFGQHGCNGNNWEESLWQALARSFGGKVNGAAFQLMAEKIPLGLLKQISYDREGIEALLLGYCGLLNNDFRDEYPQSLKAKYLYLKSKYDLSHPPVRVAFLRMRPAGFPTLRLSQLSQLIYEKEGQLLKVLDASELKELMVSFNIKSADYWNEHYVFEVKSAFREKYLGNEAVSHLVINVLAVFNYAYGLFNQREDLKQKAIDWLLKLKPERNNITAIFDKLPFQLKSAYDTQAVTYMYKVYCQSKKCMQCAIGHALIKGQS